MSHLPHPLRTSTQEAHSSSPSPSRVGTESYSFHLLPSGLISPNVDNLIGSGVVFNLDAFFHELAQLESKGVPRVRERIHVSSRCHVNFALHAAVDAASERELGKGQIGTTKRGIGPSQSSKAAREGLRVGDLYRGDFEERFERLYEGYRKRYGELLDGYGFEEEVERVRRMREELRPFIVDAVEFMRDVKEGKGEVLVESSQALSRLM